MHGRIPLLAVLVASLTLAGQAAAHGSHREAAIAGVVVGALIGGVIASNSRYPVYVEIGLPPPVVYYEPYPIYYHPYPVYQRHPYYQYQPRHHKHHRHHRGYYAAPRW
ncbi:hypothetical protein [Pseudomonas sp. UBA2684]|uniref:hypothetical protein n=1 Tax=Pseudomonas sp. UBA2684 TaxID=1947311 RepID=UPI000E8967D8|nr:hypothetical protein [Pseudomonas sp. UBA2684]HBX56284.1 hypothetical protein [Pseudomonas sp.]|tara:strand:+ start:1052 stop:1375 length:324 start_codon:yes stop_codon:yes gene_type:complete